MHPVRSQHKSNATARRHHDLGLNVTRSGGFVVCCSEYPFVREAVAGGTWGTNTRTGYILSEAMLLTQAPPLCFSLPLSQVLSYDRTPKFSAADTALLRRANVALVGKPAACRPMPPAERAGQSSQDPFASWCARRPLLTPQVNPWSLYRCGWST